MAQGAPIPGLHNERIAPNYLRFVDSVGFRLWLLSPLAYRVKDLTMLREAVPGHVTRFHPMSLSEGQA